MATMTEKKRNYTKELVALVNKVPEKEQVKLMYMLKGMMYVYEGRKHSDSN